MNQSINLYLSSSPTTTPPLQLHYLHTFRRRRHYSLYAEIAERASSPALLFLVLPRAAVVVLLFLAVLLVVVVVEEQV